MARRLIIETLTVLALFTLTVDVVSRISPLEVQHDLSNGKLWMAVDSGYLLTERYRAVRPSAKLQKRSWSVLGFTFADAVVSDWTRERPDLWFSNSAFPVPGKRHRLTTLSFPLWIMFVPLAAYPFVAFVRGPMRRYKQKRHGGCSKCGYDLTGNVSGRCPECGAAVKGNSDAYT